MALFWSKKPKAEKNYDEKARKTKSALVPAGKGKKLGSIKTETTSAAKKTVSPVVQAGETSNIAGAIIRPRITEKSGLLSQTGVYTFEVTDGSTKQTIAKAVTALYKVTPVKIAIVNLPDKNVFVKGRRGIVQGIRKALVTLKKGDKIDFV